jgi:hypothetical protein
VLASQYHWPADQKKDPPTDFSKWATNLTKFTTSERMGIIFGFFAFQYNVGWQMIQSWCQ